jgi:hypothetical protein
MKCKGGDLLLQGAYQMMSRGDISGILMFVGNAEHDLAE